jgi:predicted RNase H-like nuclease (RuvC/YqgF family)
MAEKKPKKAWWLDQSSNFTGGVTYGDEMPEKVPQSRLDELEKIGKIAYEEPEEKEVVTASQIDKLRAALVKANDENAELKEIIAKTPKGVAAAKKEVKALTDELKTLKESSLKTDSAKAEELATAKSRITDLEGFLKEREEEVAQLKSDIEEATKPKGAK